MEPYLLQLILTGCILQINPYVLSMVNRSWRLFLVFVAGVTILCTIFGYFFKPLKPDDKQVDEVTHWVSMASAFGESSGL